MTEAEWLACQDPQAMLTFLSANGRRSERKLRLFACAAVRRAWHLLGEESSQQVVRIAERSADGDASPKKRRRAFRDSAFVISPTMIRDFGAQVYYAAEAGRLCARQDIAGAVVQITGQVVDALRYESMSMEWNVVAKGERGSIRQQAEWAAQAALLRDIFGKPLRPTPVLDLAVRAWQDGLVLKLALAAYEERALPAGTLDPVRLAVLADALEETGVSDAGLLDHLRGPGPHVRGCWAVDAVLGRA